MLSFTLQTKIFMAIEPIDMRRGFDSLAAWVKQNLGRKVLDGDVFLFLSKRLDRLKVLWWEGDGYRDYESMRAENWAVSHPEHVRQYRVQRHATQLTASRSVATNVVEIC